MSNSPLPRLARCRSRARLLLNHLHGADSARADAAAQRFRRLRSLADDDLAALRHGGRVRHKHALTVVAVELGFQSWSELKAACRSAETSVAPRSDAQLPDDAMYEDRMTLWLNRWFADYDEARESLARDGGYLLPFRRQFFITARDAIRELGLDPDDADWQRIGFDWVRPLDAAAHARLVAQRRAAMA